MPIRRPLVSISGKLSQLPSGDSLAGAVLQSDLEATGSVLASGLQGLRNQLSGIVSGESANLRDLVRGISGLSGQQTILSGNISTLNSQQAALSGRVSSLSSYVDASFTTIPDTEAAATTVITLLLEYNAQISGILAGQIAAISTGAATGGLDLTALTGASGVLARKIESTGQRLWDTTRQEAVMFSGNVAQTGQNLAQWVFGSLNTFSGQVATSDGLNTLSGALNQTGGALVGKINSLSGFSASASSLASTGGQVWTTAQNNATNLSGTLFQTGSTLSQQVTSLSGYAASAADLTATGSTLLTLIGASTAGVATLNGGSGTLTLTGAGSVSVSRLGQVITVSGAPAGEVTANQLTQTGVQLGAAIGSLSGYTVSSLQATGAALYGHILDLSGQASADYATNASLGGTGQKLWADLTNNAFNLSGALTQTGVVLAGKINSLSGFSASTANLASTGQQAWMASQNNAINLSGTLLQTGSTLSQQLVALSGYAASATNLTATGATLLGLIGASSAGVAALNGASGVITLVGTGSVSVTRSEQVITISGAAVGGEVTASQLTQTGVQILSKLDSLSGYAASSVNLQATGSALYGQLNGLSGWTDATHATKSNLEATGQAALAWANSHAISLSGGLTQTGVTLVTKINSLSGYAASSASLASTGQQAWSAAQNNAVNLSGNLLLTGSTLSSKVDVLSGSAASASSLTTTGSTLLGLIAASSGRVINLNGVSGVIALTGAGSVTVTNNGQTLTISGAAGSDVTTSQLTQTGVLLGGKIDSLSGFSTANFATKTGLSATGQEAWTAATNNATNLSGALSQSGILLGARVDSLSGWSASATALASTGQQAWTVANNHAINLSGTIAQTGSTLASQVSSLSGWSAPVTLLNSVGSTLSGNLTQTGVTLVSRIDGVGTNVASTGSTLAGRIDVLSGYANSSYATIPALASTGQQAWIVGNNNAINLSGNLTQTGIALTSSINALSGWSAPLTTIYSVGSSLSGTIDQTGSILNSRLALVSGMVAQPATKTLAVFTALDNQPPASAFATLDTRNNIAVLDFDDTSIESGVFVTVIPEGTVLASGIKARIHWMATTGTAGNVVWGTQMERGDTDLDVDSFDVAVEATGAVNATCGKITTTEITMTGIDLLAAGELARLRVYRKASDAGDTVGGDAEMVAIELRSAA